MVDWNFGLKMTFCLDLPCVWQVEKTVQWDGINYNREGLMGSVWSPFLGVFVWLSSLTWFWLF